LRLAEGAVQVVVGPIADQLAAEIRAALRGQMASTSPPRPVTPPAAASPAQQAVPTSVTPDHGDAPALLAALGGAANLLGVEAISTRLVVRVKDAGAVNEAGVQGAGFRAAARVAPQTWHVIVGPGAMAVAATLAPASQK
jgi:PTS system N-acetylglucosamine-specific IIC component